MAGRRSATLRLVITFYIIIIDSRRAIAHCSTLRRFTEEPCDRRRQPRAIMSFILHSDLESHINPAAHPRVFAGASSEAVLQDLPGHRVERFAIGQDVAVAITSLQQLMMHFRQHPARQAATTVMAALDGEGLAGGEEPIARLSVELYHQLREILAVQPTIGQALAALLRAVRRVPDVPISAEALSAFVEASTSLQDMYSSVVQENAAVRNDIRYLAGEVRSIGGDLNEAVHRTLNIDLSIERALHPALERLHEEWESGIQKRLDTYFAQLNQEPTAPGSPPPASDSVHQLQATDGGPTTDPGSPSVDGAHSGDVRMDQGDGEGVKLSTLEDRIRTMEELAKRRDEEQCAEIDDLRGKLRAMEEETKRRQEELPGLIEQAVSDVLNARRQTAVAFGSGLSNPVSYSFGAVPTAE